VWGWGRVVHTGIRCRYLKIRYHLEELGVYEMMVLKDIFRKLDGRTWTNLIWLRAETSGNEHVGFHNIF
jgi:hypothetical protein